jgi:hypothetical protein
MFVNGSVYAAATYGRNKAHELAICTALKQTTKLYALCSVQARCARIVPHGMKRRVQNMKAANLGTSIACRHHMLLFAGPQQNPTHGFNE